MPETTGREASSTRIAAEIALVHAHAASGLPSTGPMQLHSLPRSHAAIAVSFLSSETRCRTIRTSHFSAVGSVSTLTPENAGGTNIRPDIHPVTSPTISRSLYSAA